MFKFLKFFKKKGGQDDLDIAFKMGLITEEERLRLRLERVKMQYEKFLKKQKK